MLLFERRVSKKDLAADLTKLEPEIGKASPGTLRSAKFPFLRRLAMVGDALPDSTVDTWEEFLARGHEESRELV
ncbi:hypothetical protein ACFVRU_54155, partial [Streptomyces sp. NPDC057927]